MGVKFTSGANAQAGLEMGRNATGREASPVTVQLRGSVRF